MWPQPGKKADVAVPPGGAEGAGRMTCNATNPESKFEWQSLAPWLCGSRGHSLQWPGRLIQPHSFQGLVARGKCGSIRRDSSPALFLGQFLDRRFSAQVK